MAGILIVGATGNTGRGVVAALPGLLKSSSLSGHRIIATTRSLNSEAAKEIAKNGDIEVVEQNWPDITPEWLREHKIERAFIAAHLEPNQFAEETTFLLAALRAGVKYVVRISTTSANVRPDCGAYYARAHWAIEALLSSPEFAALKWTSLQPNIFTSTFLYGAVAWVKEQRKTGNAGPLRLLADKDAPVGIVDAIEVGTLAAHLLVQDDTTKHHGAKYTVHGPEDINGEQIVRLVEEAIGTKVKDVVYRDMSILDIIWETQYAGTKQSRNVIMSMVDGTYSAWNGETPASATSPEVLALAGPKNSPIDIFKALVQ